MKLTILFLFLSILTGPSSSFANELLLKLPVRVMAPASKPMTDLNLEDFQLHINEKIQPLTNVVKKKRSIQTTSSGLQLILSVNATTYGPHLEQLISHTIKNLLTPSHHLLVRSPLHTYQINTSFSPDQLVQYIQSNLEKDIHLWKKNKQNALDRLDQLIDTIENKLDKKKGGLRSVLMFINHYTNEWQHFNKTFLISHLEQYPEMASQVAEKKGEKWLIHFQQLNMVPMLSTFQRVSARLKKYLSKLPKHYQDQVPLISKSLDNIENSMLFSGDFPLDELMNALLGVNINCNVVFFNPSTPATTGPPSGYEGILKNIAHQTGGMSLTTEATGAADSPLVNALTTITNHVDSYYELVFALPPEPQGKNIQDKNINIKVPHSQANVFHKNKFKKEELRWLQDWMNQTINLGDFKLTDHQLSFTITGFKMKAPPGKQETEGYVKVEIQLMDDQNNTVYQTGNTLKSLDRTVTVSLNIPSKLNGYFKLNMTAIDLISNKNCQLKKYVKL